MGVVVFRSTSCNSSSSNPFCTLTNISPLLALTLVTIPMNTKCAGAYGLFTIPYIKLPPVPNHTGSPALAVLVFNPASNPSAITLPKPLIVTVEAIRPIVLEELTSAVFEASPTIMLVPSAPVT